MVHNRLIGLVGRVFANGSGDMGSIPGFVILKTFKMVLDATLLNTQKYKVCIKGKVEQSRERSSALLYTSVLKREPSNRPRLRSPIKILLLECLHLQMNWILILNVPLGITVSLNHPPRQVKQTDEFNFSIN